MHENSEYRVIVTLKVKRRRVRLNSGPLLGHCCMQAEQRTQDGIATLRSWLVERRSREKELQMRRLHFFCSTETRASGERTHYAARCAAEAELLWSSPRRSGSAGIAANTDRRDPTNVGDF